MDKEGRVMRILKVTMVTRWIKKEGWCAYWQLTVVTRWIKKEEDALYLAISINEYLICVALWFQSMNTLSVMLCDGNRWIHYLWCRACSVQATGCLGFSPGSLVCPPPPPAPPSLVPHLWGNITSEMEGGEQTYGPFTCTFEISRLSFM